MAVVQRLKHLVDVETNIVISERLVQGSEVDVASVNVFHDESWSLGHRISDNIDEINDVDSTSERLENFNFTSNLGLFYRLQDLDYDALIVQSVNPFVDLRVFSSSNLLDDFIVFLRSKTFVKSKISTYPNLTSKFS